MKPIDIAHKQLAKARSRSTARDSDTIKRQERSQRSSGIYQSYNASTGFASVRLADGSIVKGKVITTSGIGVGDRVSVAQPYGSPYAFIKIIPR